MPPQSNTWSNLSFDSGCWERPGVEAETEMLRSKLEEKTIRLKNFERRVAALKDRGGEMERKLKTAQIVLTAAAAGVLTLLPLTSHSGRDGAEDAVRREASFLGMYTATGLVGMLIICAVYCSAPAQLRTQTLHGPHRWQETPRVRRESSMLSDSGPGRSRTRRRGSALASGRSSSSSDRCDIGRVGSAEMIAIGKWSDFYGVEWNDEKSVFSSTFIIDDREVVHLGDFEKEEDAARAYDKAAQAQYGHLAVLNFPDR